jgi:hypothetical protein
VASAVGLEKNIAEFTDGLNVIKQIHPVSYNYGDETGITSMSACWHFRAGIAKSCSLHGERIDCQE